MPVYKVTDTSNPEGAPRLVEAPSSKRAISHVTGQRFAAAVISNASEVGKLMKAGIELEEVGAEPEASDDGGETQSNEIEANQEKSAETDATAAKKERTPATA